MQVSRKRIKPTCVLTVPEKAALDQAVSALLADTAKANEGHTEPRLWVADDPIELITVLRDGLTTYLIVSCQVMNGVMQRMTVVSFDQVQISPWASYKEPLIVGPWIFFDDFYGDKAPPVGYVEWGGERP